MEWLALKHPDIVLNKWQIHMLKSCFGEHRMILHTPLRAGKNYLLNLVKEYISDELEQGEFRE